MMSETSYLRRRTCDRCDGAGMVFVITGEIDSCRECGGSGVTVRQITRTVTNDSSGDAAARRAKRNAEIAERY